MTRFARPAFGPVIGALALVVALAACGSAATPSPAVPGATTPGGGPTAPGGSPIVGGLTTAPELEAALPSTLCGKPSKKGSAAGSATVDASAPPNPFAAFGGGAGGAFAFADSTDDSCDTSAVAFSATGMGSGFMMQAIALAAAGSGTGGQVNLGGKQVYKLVDTPTSTYIYAKGDALFAVEAATDDAAAEALQQMP